MTIDKRFDLGRLIPGRKGSDEPPPLSGDERRPPPIPEELLASVQEPPGQEPPGEEETAAPPPEAEQVAAGGEDRRLAAMRAFKAQFEPHLDAIDRVRRRGWQSAAIAMVACALALYVAVRAAGGSFGVPGTGWIALAAALLIGLPVGYIAANALYARRVGRRLLPLLGEAIGTVEYKGNKRRGFDLATFSRLGLIDERLRLRGLEDRFAGRYRDTDFQMMEAVYVPTRKENEDIHRFRRGLLIRLSVPVPFEGTTILHAARDRARRGRLARYMGGRKFQPVTLDDPVFDLRYQVRSDRPEEARALVTPELRDAMLAMTNERQGELVRGALHKGEFWMSMPVWRPLFEVASLTTSRKALEERVLRAADEITVVHRVIDQLHGSGPGRLL